MFMSLVGALQKSEDLSYLFYLSGPTNYSTVVRYGVGDRVKHQTRKLILSTDEGW